jgi:hypothetical protein
MNALISGFYPFSMLMKEISSSLCSTNIQYQQFRNSGRYRDLWHLHIPRLPKTTQQHLFLKRLPKFYLFQTTQTTMHAAPSPDATNTTVSKSTTIAKKPHRKANAAKGTNQDTPKRAQEDR